VVKVQIVNKLLKRKYIFVFYCWTFDEDRIIILCSEYKTAFFVKLNVVKIDGIFNPSHREGLNAEDLLNYIWSCFFMIYIL
jgi:hypothetical protein